MSSQLEPLTSIDLELAERLEKDERFRNRYLRRWAQNEVATEIRGLRKRRGKLQAEVARLANTGQSAISRIEKAEYDGWTFKTLLAIGDALRARLRITFEPIEDVVRSLKSSASTTAVQVEETSTAEKVAAVVISIPAEYPEFFSTDKLTHAREVTRGSTSSAYIN